MSNKNEGAKLANPESRDGFKSKWGFIIACIGSAVGMANIWRFPYMVATYGGMTFLLPYFLFVLLIFVVLALHNYHRLYMEVPDVL